MRFHFFPPFILDMSVGLASHIHLKIEYSNKKTSTTTIADETSEGSEELLEKLRTHPHVEYYAPQGKLISSPKLNCRLIFKIFK